MAGSIGSRVFEQLEPREFLDSNSLLRLAGLARQSAISRIPLVEETSEESSQSIPDRQPLASDQPPEEPSEGPTPRPQPVDAADRDDQKPRLVVLTDIGGGDPDDEQSMVRLLAYSNEFDIEGLVAGASLNGSNTTNVSLIHNIVDQYELVRDNLLAHKADFPAASYLRSKVAVGQPSSGIFGEGLDTPGSELIIQAVDAEDPRPLNIAIWGGSTDLAQALWRVSQTRTPEEVEEFVAKMRVAWIEQNSSDAWIKANFPSLWVVSHLAPGVSEFQAPFRGMYLGGDTSLTTAQWVRENVKAHQPYGNPYPVYAASDEMKEGDTPTWFYFLPSNLSDPDHPEWGGWGGRYYKNGNLYSPAADHSSDGTFGRNTVNRWREEYQNDFAARMDWTSSPQFSQANHNPVAEMDHPNQLRIQSGESLTIDASESWDPDGDALTFEWLHYEEVGSVQDPIALVGANTSQVRFTAPDVSTPQTLHLILRLRDQGTPNLFDYQRVVITVSPATESQAAFDDSPTPPNIETPPKPSTRPQARTVAYFPFNEGRGRFAYDGSGLANNAVLVNTEEDDWVAGIEGSAIRLDELNERVRIPNSPSWAGPQDSFSISAWVRFDEIPHPYSSVFSVGSWDDQRINVYTLEDGLQLYAASDEWETLVSTADLPFLQSFDDRFHHLVVVKDAITHSASIFVDGRPVGHDPHSSGSVDLGEWDFSFCGDSLGEKQLACSLDEATLYHGALTEAEIQSLYYSRLPNANNSTATHDTDDQNLEFRPPRFDTVPSAVVPSAVVDLVFSEGDGQTFADQSGHENHATLLNTERKDWDGQATTVTLDGQNESLRVPSDDSWAILTEAVTVSMWIRFDDPLLSTYGSLFSVGNWNDQRLNAYPLNGQLIFFADSSNQDVLVTSPWQSFLWEADGKFHHIVAVKDSDTASLYIDGVLVGKDEYAAGNLDLRGWELSFCANSEGEKSLPCTISAVSLVHRAMTATEVLGLYEKDA